MKYGIFDKETGRLTSTVDVPDTSPVVDNVNIVLVGNYSCKRHYLNLETMTVEDAGDAPSAFHYLSGMLGWVLDTNAAESATRAYRDLLLSKCDWVEYPSNQRRLGIALLSAWDIYRQQLRDITAQPEFPIQVTWPTKPQGD